MSLLHSLASALLALVATIAQADAPSILGEKPAYLDDVATTFANDGAILRRIWAPGLEEGFVPQGLAVAGKEIYVSAYRSTDPKVDRGPCRVFKIDGETGKELGHFDMPPECGHSGGVVYLGDGILVVSDTRDLWRIDAQKALASGKAEGALRGAVKLGGDLYGSFLGVDGKELWIGRYTVRKDAALARIHRVPIKVFEEFDGRTLTEAHVGQTLVAPPLGQGMAFDKDHIWIAASSSQIGWIHELDRSGKEVARYDTIIGIEGMAFDAQGRLWAVSEAGAKKWMHWQKHFPVVFVMDVAKLH